MKINYISLGSFCHPKIVIRDSMREYSESLPFDFNSSPSLVVITNILKELYETKTYDIQLKEIIVNSNASGESSLISKKNQLNNSTLSKLPSKQPLVAQPPHQINSSVLVKSSGLQPELSFQTSDKYDIRTLVISCNEINSKYNNQVTDKLKEDCITKILTFSPQIIFITMRNSIDDKSDNVLLLKLHNYLKEYYDFISNNTIIVNTKNSHDIIHITCVYILKQEVELNLNSNINNMILDLSNKNKNKIFQKYEKVNKTINDKISIEYFSHKLFRHDNDNDGAIIVFMKLRNNKKSLYICVLNNINIKSEYAVELNNSKIFVINSQQNQNQNKNKAFEGVFEVL